MLNTEEPKLPQMVQEKELKDWGCTPISESLYKMIPSGDVVDLKERNRRFGH